MRSFGINLAATDTLMPVAELARAVEERGLDGIYFADHTHLPKNATSPLPGPVPEVFGRIVDPLIAMATAAAVTKRIKIGTSVLLAVQRDPIVLAKQVASIDFLSGGRVVLGVGVGGVPEENVNHGVPVKQRWKVMAEKIRAAKAIWSNHEAEFHGEFVNFDPIICDPKPVQAGGPPVLLGVSQPRGIRRIAEDCYDGWIPNLSPRLNLLDGLKLYRESAERAGRDLKSLMLLLVGIGPEEKTIEPLLGLGIEQFSLRVPSAGADEVLPALDLCAELARKFR